MLRSVITFGLVGGIIIALFIFLEGTLIERSIIPMSWTEVIGYATMLVSMSMVFFGIKSYRDNYGNGTITFWKGLQIGLLISLIASVMYFAGGELYNAANPNFFPKLMERVTEQQTNTMKAKGVPQEDIDKKNEEMAQFATMFGNPLIRFAIFIMEMFPVGIVVTIVSSAVLRRRDVLPA